jgi:putative glutathione S-transferase
MGLLVDGQWQDKWYDTESTGGRFVRQESRFRNWITVDGAPGPTGEGGFAAEPDRYHLYVALACPWANRTLIFRKLKRLEDMIGISVVNPHMGSDGWTFEPGYSVVPDIVNGARHLYDIYLKADSSYTGRVTVPVLWDKRQRTIVSNESADIIRMFNSAFDALGAASGDFYPLSFREEIDEINGFVYSNINNGVYKAGFATTQDVYEEAVGNLFRALDTIETRLAHRRWLVGNRITEADWRLFTTLVRFDPVYVGHFKCNIRNLREYPHLWGYVRDLYQQPGVAETVDLDAIKLHYYGSHETINPTGLVPVGPTIDYSAPHDRASLG